MIDVLNKTCIYENCITIPNFNLPNEKIAIYCAKHKLKDMINVKSRTCIHPNCKTRPNFNVISEKLGLYCDEHKNHNMVNVKSQRCLTENCGTIVRNKYKGYCVFCFINLFPDEPVSRNYKSKERHITDAIKAHFKDYEFICDKRIQHGCYKRRPDMLLSLKTHHIIFEIDENQHIDYDISCENKRIMEISNDLKHEPIVFIRFNPDDFIDKNGRKVSSCFGVNGNGIITATKSKQKELSKRLETLFTTLQYWIDNVSDITIKTVKLYYDNYE